MASHPMVTQLRFTRSEFLRGLDGVTDQEARRRFDPMNGISWISLAILIGTGMVQLGANPNYTGFLGIDNNWAIAILLKHIAFGGILLLSSYQTWGLAPAIERLALLQAKGKADPNAQAALRKRESRILQINTILSVIVLFFTALARIS